MNRIIVTIRINQKKEYEIEEKQDIYNIIVKNPKEAYKITC